MCWAGRGRGVLRGVTKLAGRYKRRERLPTKQPKPEDPKHLFFRKPFEPKPLLPRFQSPDPHLQIQIPNPRVWNPRTIRPRAPSLKPETALLALESKRFSDLGVGLTVLFLEEWFRESEVRRGDALLHALRNLPLHGEAPGGGHGKHLKAFPVLLFIVRALVGPGVRSVVASIWSRVYTRKQSSMPLAIYSSRVAPSRLGPCSRLHARLINPLP